MHPTTTFITFPEQTEKLPYGVQRVRTLRVDVRGWIVTPVALWRVKVQPSVHCVSTYQPI